MHRFNEMAGCLLLVVAEFVALIGFTAFFGRTGRRAAAIRRRRGGSIRHFRSAGGFGSSSPSSSTALILHLLAWFQFPMEAAQLECRRQDRQFALCPRRRHDVRLDRRLRLLCFQPRSSAPRPKRKPSSATSCPTASSNASRRPGRDDRRRLLGSVGAVCRHHRLRQHGARPWTGEDRGASQPARERIRRACRASRRREDQDDRRCLHGGVRRPDPARRITRNRWLRWRSIWSQPSQQR